MISRCLLSADMISAFSSQDFEAELRPWSGVLILRRDEQHSREPVVTFEVVLLMLMLEVAVVIQEEQNHEEVRHIQSFLIQSLKVGTRTRT